MEANALGIFEKKRLAEKQHFDETVKNVQACLKNVRVDQVFAAILNNQNCSSLSVRWMVEYFWHLRMPAMVESLNKIYDELVLRKATENKAVNYNDGDDNLWYEPCKSSKVRRVIACTGQSTKMLYIWDLVSEMSKLENDLGFDNGNLHIRKFYDRIQDVHQDKWEEQEEQEFKKRIAKNGRAAAVLEADTLMEYADDGYAYPHRLSLKAFRKNKFELRYGDARDPGYILSWEAFMKKVDYPLQTFSRIDMIEQIEIPCMLTELFSEC